MSFDIEIGEVQDTPQKINDRFHALGNKQCVDEKCEHAHYTQEERKRLFDGEGEQRKPIKYSCEDEESWQKILERIQLMHPNAEFSHDEDGNIYFFEAIVTLQDGEEYE